MGPKGKKSSKKSKTAKGGKGKSTKATSKGGAKSKGSKKGGPAPPAPKGSPGMKGPKAASKGGSKAAPKGGSRAGPQAGAIKGGASKKGASKMIASSKGGKGAPGSGGPNTWPTIKLNNGVEVPVMGLGTFYGEGSVEELNAKAHKAVTAALQCGYRFIDTAFVYFTYAGVGKAVNEWIKSGKGKREDLYIMSKVWPTYFKGDRPKQCVQRMLKEMGLDYLDAIMIHWPQALFQQDAQSGPDCFPKDESGFNKLDEETTFEECYRSLEECHSQGLVKAIGVCNFNKSQIERLMKAKKVMPTFHQFESHPWFPNNELKQQAIKLGMTPMAYCPVGSDVSMKGRDPNKKLTQDPAIQELAKKYKKSGHQICIRFQIDRGVIPLPKSTNPAHLKANCDVFDFTLTPDEVKKLENLNVNYRFVLMAGHVNHKDYPFTELKGKVEPTGNLV